jgi:hypothetical protein
MNDFISQSIELNITEVKIANYEIDNDNVNTLNDKCTSLVQQFKQMEADAASGQASLNIREIELSELQATIISQKKVEHLNYNNELNSLNVRLQEVLQQLITSIDYMERKLRELEKRESVDYNSKITTNFTAYNSLNSQQSRHPMSNPNFTSTPILKTPQPKHFNDD